jgi:FkbM family methyltransferase
MVQRVIDRARRILAKIGIDMVKYDIRYHPIARLGFLLAKKDITIVIDVGANDGGFARIVRLAGFRQRIISVEPSTQAFEALEARARRQTNWDCLKLALGDHDGVGTLNIAANSESSSLLEMLPAHSDAAPDSMYIGTEQVTMLTLDSLVRRENLQRERIFLKLDAQGYEDKILHGAGSSLSCVQGIMLEMSLLPLYRGESSFHELDPKMNRLGFVLYSLEPVFFSENSSQLMQVNGIYLRQTD